MSTFRCPYCGAPASMIHRDEEGRLVCSRCGYVIEESPLDLGPEWRSFTEEDRVRRSRAGSPLSNVIHDYGVTTYIYPSREPRSRKLAALQASLRTHGHRKLVTVLQELNRASAKLRVPKRVHETAALILRRLTSKGVVKRNNVTEYVAASLVYAARIERHPLTMQSVTEALGVPRNTVWKAYRNIHKSMDQRTRTRMRARPPKPQEFIPQIASRLGLSGEVEMLAVRLSAMLVKTGLSQGKPPAAIAAASVYLASILLDQKRNQSEVASVVGVTDATIRNRYRDIVDNFYIEVQL